MKHTRSPSHTEVHKHSNVGKSSSRSHGRSKYSPDSRSPSPSKSKFNTGSLGRNKVQYASSLAAELRKVGQMRKKENVADTSPQTPQQSSLHVSRTVNVIDLDPPDPCSPHVLSISQPNSSSVINLIPQSSQSTIVVDQTAAVICDTTIRTTQVPMTKKTNVRHSGVVSNSVPSNNSTCVQLVHKPNTLPALPLPAVVPDSDSDMDLDKSPHR